MAQDMNLEQIGRRVWRSLFLDGLLDIYMGLLLMVMGAVALLWDATPSRLAYYAIYFALVALAFLIFWAGKRFITVPRLGRVRFGRAWRMRSRKVSAIVTILVIAQVVLIVLVLTGSLALPGLEALPRGRGLLALGLAAWIALIFGVVSYLLDFNRGYVIGVLYALGFGGTELLDNPITFLLAGGAIVLMGVAVFIRFLRKYPVAGELVFDGNARTCP